MTGEYLQANRYTTIEARSHTISMPSGTNGFGEHLNGTETPLKKMFLPESLAIILVVYAGRSKMPLSELTKNEEIPNPQFIHELTKAIPGSSIRTINYHHGDYHYARYIFPDSLDRRLSFHLRHNNRGQIKQAYFEIPTRQDKPEHGIRKIAEDLSSVELNNGKTIHHNAVFYYQEDMYTLFKIDKPHNRVVFGTLINPSGVVIRVPFQELVKQRYIDFHNVKPGAYATISS